MERECRIDMVLLCWAPVVICCLYYISEFRNSVLRALVSGTVNMTTERVWALSFILWLQKCLYRSVNICWINGNSKHSCPVNVRHSFAICFAPWDTDRNDSMSVQSPDLQRKACFHMPLANFSDVTLRTCSTVPATPNWALECAHEALSFHLTHRHMNKVLKSQATEQLSREHQFDN